MSTTKTKDITTELCEQYDDAKLTPDLLAINGGSVRVLMNSGHRVTSDFAALFITFYFPTVGFKAKEGKVKIDKVETALQMMVSYCDVNVENGTCDWLYDKRFSIHTGEEDFNIKVYHKGVELESVQSTNPSDPWWLLELPPMISKDCSDKVNAHLCQKVKENSTDDDIRSTVLSLLEQWDAFDKE